MDEYEMVSHVKLKHLEGSMEKLSKSLNDMIDVFSSAATAMHVEEKEEKALDPVMRKIDMLIDQNQKIASGILAVADMIKEQMPRIEEALSRVERPSFMERMPKPVPRPAPPRQMMPPSPMPAVMEQRAPSKPPMPPGLSAFERPAETKKKDVIGGLFK